MKVGDVVKLKTPMLGEKLHSVGVVCNNYGTGVQIIFENGGFDEFSTEEQTDFLMFITHAAEYASYKFKSSLQVAYDFDAGYWKSVFTKHNVQDF